MSVILPPSGSVYSDTLDSFFYFDEFVSLAAQPAAKAILDAEGLPEGTTLWELFIRSPANTFGLPLDTDAITPGNQLPDPSIQSIAVRDAFLAFVQDFKKSDLWLRFLGMLGIDPDTVTPGQLNDPILQKAFLDFAKGTLVLLQSQQVQLTSMDEVKKRDIMFETFAILLQMLATLQDSIGVVGQNLIFYGKWQEAFTKLLTKVPTYVGGASSAPNVPQPVTVDNLDKFTFGYAAISAEDIANWAADKLQGTVPTSFRMNMSSDTINNLMTSITFLDGMDGRRDQDMLDSIRAQLVNNSFLEISVDPVNQKVSFSIGGIDLTKFQSSPNADPLFGAGGNSNFAFHVESTAGRSGLTVDGFDASSGTEFTGVQSLVGAVYQTGHFRVANTVTDPADLVPDNAVGKVVVDANGNAQYATSSNSLDVTIPSTDFNSAVVSIKNAFVSFWNDAQTQSSVTGGSVTGIRMQINAQWLYDNGDNAIFDLAGTPTIDAVSTIGAVQTSGTNAWFSDYQLNGGTFTDVVAVGWEASQTSSGSPLNSSGVTVTVPQGPILGVGPTIPWLEDRVFISNSTDEATKLRADNASKARAEVNAKLQQYIENIRSRRQLVQEQSQQIESNLSQFKEGVTNWATLMSSILDSMKSIIASIFK